MKSAKARRAESECNIPLVSLGNDIEFTKESIKNFQENGGCWNCPLGSDYMNCAFCNYKKSTSYERKDHKGEEE